MDIIISAAVSLDGYIDDASTQRLVLSNEQDWERVRALRLQCDAILIGARTLRNDNPALITKSQEVREKRASENQKADPIKIVVSRSCDIDPQSRFFTTGDNRKIVVTASEKHSLATEKFGHLAEIIAIAEPITAPKIVDALSLCGIKTMMVEGGSQMLKLFLESGYVDMMRLAVAPFFVGSEGGVRFLEQGIELFDKENRMELISTEKVGDMTVSKYDTRSEIRKNLIRTIELAKNCPSSNTAYSVGAMIVTLEGDIFEGYSRQSSPINHAEEEAILAAQEAGADLRGASIYSSMEPCSQRSSKPRSCSQLIIDNKFARVVFAVAEPENFVNCTGRKMLQDAGLEVIVMADLAEKALEPNRHIVL